MVASVEETDSSASSASSGRHSADLPIVGPPCGLAPRSGLLGEKSFSGFSVVCMYTYINRNSYYLQELVLLLL